MHRYTWLLLLLALGCDQKKPPADVETEEDVADVSDVPDTDIISVTSSSTEIPPDGTWNIPEDSPTPVDIFTTTPEMFTITNISSSPVTINRIFHDEADGVMDEEFEIRETDSLDSATLIVDDVILSPSGTFGFWVHFRPITGGTREATVEIQFDSVRSWTFTVTGSGAPEDTALFTDGGPALHRVLGTPDGDEYVAGLAIDELGNSYLSAHATSIIDTDAEDIIITRFSRSGDRDWAKIWHSSHTEGHRDWIGPTTDPSHGGASDSITHDTDHIYIAGSTNATTANPESANMALVLKVDAMTGDLAWDRIWTPVSPPTTPSHASKAHAIDVSTSHVYITGTTGADTSTEHSHLFLLALDKATGDSILFQQAFDLNSDDIGYSVRVTTAGNAYIAGETDGDGFILRLTSADTATPSLDWAKQFDSLGPVLSLDTESSGDPVLSIVSGDGFTVMRLSRMDGAVVWAKTWSGTTTTHDHAHVLRVSSTSVIAGGTIDGFGSTGDGFMLHLLASTGELEWATLYFTGPSPADTCAHIVKGLAILDDTLFVAGQVTTHDSNTSRYFGYWYDAPGSLSDVSPDMTDLTPTSFSMSGTSSDASPSRTWEDLPAAVVDVEAWNKTEGTPPDTDLFWQTIFI